MMVTALAFFLASLCSCIFLCFLIPWVGATQNMTTDRKANDEYNMKLFLSKARLLATSPSDCVPSNTIILILVNSHHANLLQLQLQFVKRHQCFINRVAVVNTDKNNTVCKRILADIPSLCFMDQSVDYMPSSYRTGHYMNMIFRKYDYVTKILPGED